MDADRDDADDDVIDEMGERGHILWIRGLSRLQHQVVHRHPARGGSSPKLQNT